MARVAIIIVTYNSAAEVGACLDALRGLGDVEVLVIDNASADDTCGEVGRRGVSLIANSVNTGFAAAVNQGVRATSAPLVLLLNPDAHLVSSLDGLAGCFDTAGTGAVGGMLVGEDGKPQRGFMARNLPTATTLVFEVLGINRLWPGNPVNWHYRCLGHDPMTSGLVDQPAGAFLMFSRAAWDKIGGFDERFWPLWFEDVDFCNRLKAAGFCSYYNSASVAKHAGSHSIRALSLENRQKYWYGSLLKYAGKHYRSSAFRTICASVVVGAVFRAVLGFPREGLKALVVYGGVIGHALSRLFGFGEASG
jgi:N-acetylglucosaminyl-diphospho-decaprenol L-rhamnosyltransferase